MTRLAQLTIALGCLAFSPFVVAADGFDIKKFAEAFIAAEKVAWESGDFAALEALEHSDVVFQNVNGTVHRGSKEHIQAIAAARASFGGARITQEWRYLMGEGNMFTVSYKWLVHLPQRPIEISGMATGRVKDGKLIEEWGITTTAPAAVKVSPQ